jgi:selenocysteine-specific elongation factor
VIIGTAGHIDHGKTALVRALTGVDTDRLPEEKRRGITIELGFAPLVLPGDRACGVVDVPGHEAFVRTMLAGATGIDVALLVIAADEGVMPQTREHLSILRLLAVPHGVVALTKADLVDDEWLALVREDVATLVAGTALEGADVVATSTIDGRGLGELRDALARLTATSRARDRADLFRLPIDRAFTVRGTGTVVTGTVWSGTLERDATVRVLPGDLVARVRGIESHGRAIDRAEPGTRVAIALAGVDHTQVARGQIIVPDPAWRETRCLRADVSLLDDGALLLGPRARVRHHPGTTEIGARVVAAGRPLAPGELRPARIALDAPMVARAGDRFVLRSGSPVATIGGGIVTDPTPPHRRARPWPSVSDDAEHRLAWLLDEAGHDGLTLSDLPVRLGVSPSRVAESLALLAHAVARLGARAYSSAAVERAADDLVAQTRAWHASNPLDEGAPLQTVRAAVGARNELLDAALARTIAAGALEVQGAVVRERGWTPRLSAEQRVLRDALVGALRAAGHEPPSVAELVTAQGASVTIVSPLLRVLSREGLVVPVEADRFYAAEAVESLVERLRAGMAPGRVYSPAELRDLLGVSRKFLIPFLEFCDRRRVTERRDTGRVLAGM